MQGGFCCYSWWRILLPITLPFHTSRSKVHKESSHSSTNTESLTDWLTAFLIVKISVNSLLSYSYYWCCARKFLGVTSIFPNSIKNWSVWLTSMLSFFRTPCNWSLKLCFVQLLQFSIYHKQQWREYPSSAYNFCVLVSKHLYGTKLTSQYFCLWWPSSEVVQLTK